MTVTAPAVDETPPAPPEEEPEPSIDELIARLDRMQMEMFKRTPKQVSEPSTDEESTETSVDKE